MTRVPASFIAAAAAFTLIATTGAARTARAPSPPPSSHVAMFAGGCFWGIEAVFEHLQGVISATAGYAGGSAVGPSYEEVSSGTTGHAESVRVLYDPSRITYRQLLEVFFRVAHDPTELNRQGPDEGTQYRSIVFYGDSEQRQVASAFMAELTKARVFSRPIVTELVPAGKFYPAEAYHQHYMAHHPDQPYIVYNDAPKLVNLKKEFPNLYQEPPAE